MKHIDRGRIDVFVRGIRLGIDFYFRDGVGLPVGFYHGGLQNHTAGIPILNHFSVNPVFAYDHPGHGHSDQFTFETATLDDYLAVDSGVRKLLGIRDYVAIGHSFGGIIAAYAASKPGSDVKALVMVNSIDKNPLLKLPKFKQRVIQASGEIYNPSLNKSYDYARSMHLTDVQILIEGYMRTPTKAAMHILDTYPEYDVRPIQTPTLIIHGNQDDLIEVQDVKEMADGIPNVVLTFIDGSHFVLNQHPDRVVKELKGLKELVDLGQ